MIRRTFPRNPFTREDTLFGICEALGEDFRFNPLLLRIAFGAPVPQSGACDRRYAAPARSSWSRGCSSPTRASPGAGRGGRGTGDGGPRRQQRLLAEVLAAAA